MGIRYQDIYPSDPLLRSQDVSRPLAADLLNLEYFEAEPDTMPTRVFDQHHILINLNEHPHRVENWRDGEHRDFTYLKDEIIVTPAGVESGWRWHARSKVIVITLEPTKFNRFAQYELGFLLSDAQLKSIPQFIDADLTLAGKLLLEALSCDCELGSALMFECMARVFLIKLIQKYGEKREEAYPFSKHFTAKHYKQVFDYVARHFSRTIRIEDLAAEAGLSTYHFSRLFKQTIGTPPHQFVMAYRIEQAKKMLTDKSRALIDVAVTCGFSDQPHFTRVFKRHLGITPRQYRQQL